MTAIASGNSLGLENTSAATLGQRGLGGSAAQGRSNEQAFVNIATGNLVLQRQDDFLPSAGADIDLVRTYNSQGLLNDDNADNWSVGPTQKVVLGNGPVNTAGSTLLRTARDGAKSTYTWDVPTSRYVSSDGAGAFDSIVVSGSEYVWTDGDSGLQERYDSANGGRLAKVVDLASGKTNVYGYSGSLLSSIETTRNDGQKEFTYYDYNTSPANQLQRIRIVTADGVAHTRVSYGYDGFNRLNKVTVDLTPDNSADNADSTKLYVTSYTYVDSASKRIASVTQTDGTSLTFTYTEVTPGDWRVASVKDALNQTTSYSYNTAARTTSVTDAASQVTVYSYDTAGQLAQISYPTVAGVTPTSSFTWDAKGNLAQTTDPQGRVVQMAYDTNGNRTLERDAAGNTVTRTFNGANQLLTETTYSVPDPDGSGSALPSGAMTTRYVYDAGNKNLLRFVISPQGRVTQYLYNGNGERSNTFSYPAAVAFDTSALGATGVPSETAMASWAAGQPQGLIERIDLTYDARGLVQFADSYSSVDGAGVGVLASRTRTQYVYDSAGLVLSTLVSSPAGNDTTGYTYDGLGRVISSTDALGKLTTTSYTDTDPGTGVKTTVQQSDGLCTTRVYDKAGQLISVYQTNTPTGTSLGATQYAYDALGHLLMTTDPTGVRQFALFDADGRKTADIDGTGSLVEYLYNKAGQLVQAIAYANAPSAAQLASLVNGAGKPTNPTVASMRPVANPTLDQKSWRVYDEAGRLAVTINAQGAATRSFYDGASRVVKTTQYATLISAAGITSASTVASLGLVTSTDDRSSYAFYDADGLLRGTVDGENYLSERRYDSAGQLTDTVRYALAVNAAALAAGATLAALIPATSPTDIQTRYFYSASGQRTGQLDGENYLTEYRYDIKGRLAQSVRYGVQRTPAATNNTLASLRPALPASGQLTTQVWDAMDRLVSSTSAEGTLSVTAGPVGVFSVDAAGAAKAVTTTYSYDSVGRLLKTTEAANIPVEARTLAQRYDIQGRLVGELTAEGSAALAALSSPSQAQIDNIWTLYGLTHVYDTAGRRMSTVDQNGAKTLFFYDADGRITHTVLVDPVNNQGEVSERQYDVLGQLSATVQYGTRISTATLTGANAGGLLTASSPLNALLTGIRNASLDSKTSYVYSNTGTLTKAIDAMNFARNYVYNTFGEQTSRDAIAMTAAGNVLTTTVTRYDHRGQVVSTTQDDGVGKLRVSNAATYDAFGRQVTSTDGLNGLRRQRYDRLGRTLVLTDALTNTSSTTYDAFDRVLTQTDALGNVASYSYNAAERSMTMTQTVMPAGTITVKTVYNSHGEVVSVTDARLSTTSYTYDANGRLKSQSTPVFHPETGVTEVVATQNSYDRAGLLASTTDANGIVTQYTYDAARRLLTRKVDAGALQLVTSTSYDAKGQQLTVTDPNNVVTQFKYDLKGELTEQTVDPSVSATGYVGLNLRTTFTYDQRGNTLTVTSPGNTLTQYTYDALGRRVQETIDPGAGKLNLTRSWRYDANSNVLASTDANGNTTLYGYDKENRNTFVVDATGGVRETVYDADGRVFKIIQYKNAINTAGLADALALTSDQLAGIAATVSPGPVDTGNIVRQRVAQNAEDAIEYRMYSANGWLMQRVTVVTVNGTQQGELTHLTRDYNGNVVEQRQYVTRVDMTAAASLTSQTMFTPAQDNAHDVWTRTAYDALNRATYVMDGTGGLARMVYDAGGRLLERTAYSKRIAIGSANEQQDFYSSAVVAMGSGQANAVQRYGYDGANRCIWSIDGVGAATRMSYDGNGNLVKTLQLATAVIATASYTATPSFANNTALDCITDHVYDKANRRTYDVDPLGAVTQFDYDLNSNLTRRLQYAVAIPPPANSFGAVLSPMVVQYTAANVLSALGGQSAASATTRISQFAYDAANRQVFAVDALGGVTETVYAANKLTTVRYANPVSMASLGVIASPTIADVRTRLTTSSATDRSDVQVFDGAGRLSLSIDAEGYATGRSYDAIGRLVESRRYFNKATGSIVPTPNALDQPTTFAYDRASRMVSSTDALTHTESTTYDGAGNKTSFTNKNGATWNYQYDAAGRLVRETSPAVKLASVALPLGAVLTVTPETTGSVVTVLAYDAFGNLASRTEAAGRTEVRTTSYEYDALGRQVKTIYPTAGVYDAASDSLGTNGVGALATRKEVQQASFSSVAYDVFGNAIAGRDVSGNWSYKTYDKLGRLRFEVDPTGAVTGYTRNLFGDATALTRYALLPKVTIGATVQPLPDVLQSRLSQGTLDGVTATSIVQPNVVADAADRTLTMQLDNLGRTIKLTEPTSFVYDPLYSYATVAKVTQTTFNAFGEMTRTATLAGGTTYFATNHYYDKNGQRTGTVDAMGYWTAFEYDAVGNLTKQAEYARAIAGWNGNAPPSTLPTTPPADLVDERGNAIQNRVTSFLYDALNRLKSQTLANVDLGNLAVTGQSLANVTTAFAYDDVGNQTQVQQANGATINTRYDALGRVTSVTGPAVNNGSNGTAAIRTLTTFQRDALGNALAQTEYASGEGATAGVPASVDAARDRTTVTAYDALGHAVQVMDANGVSHYASYDAAGHLAKEWQSVTVDAFNQVNVAAQGSAIQTEWKVYHYDAAGRLDRVTQPGAGYQALNMVTVLGTTGNALMGNQLSSTSMFYNTFGEMIARGTAGTGAGNTPGNTGVVTKDTAQEQFSYDNAGHMVRTNAGDGQVKFYLYNLSGQQTATIQSAGMGRDNLDLSQYTTVQQVYYLTSVRRTDYTYDANGRVLVERQPDRVRIDNTTNGFVRPVINRTWDRWGNLLTESDPRSANWKTYYAYNAAGQMTRQTQFLANDPNAAVVMNATTQIDNFHQYDVMGRSVSERDANGNTSSTERDAAGNVVREVHADTGIVQHRFSAFGEEVGTTDEVNRTTSYTYDRLGQLLNIDKGTVHDIGYDRNAAVAQDRLITRFATYTYDEAGHRTTETNGNDETTRYSFDLRGNVTRTTLADGSASYQMLDDLGRKVATRDAAGLGMDWRYDYFGQLRSHTDLGGTSYLYTYDNARQLCAEIGTNAGTAINVRPKNLRYAYDAAGQLIRVLDWQGYNEVTRAMSFEQQALVYDYQYDLAGHRMFEQTLQWGQAVQSSFNDWDSLGRLTHVGNATGFQVGVYPELDAKAYYIFNPSVQAAYAADSHGLSMEEFAQYHWATVGQFTPGLIGGNAAVTTDAQRAANMATAAGTYYRSNNPPALAAYMLLNRITLAQMATAISQTGPAVSASDLATWFSQRSVQAADYTYQEPVPAPPMGAVLGPSTLPPEQARKNSIVTLWNANYNNPRMVAAAMLQYRITVEELAYTVGYDTSTVAAGRAFVQQYFAFNNIDPSLYDITRQQALVDDGRNAAPNTTLYPQLLGLYNQGNATGLAAALLDQRVSPAALALLFARNSGHPPGTDSTSFWLSYFTQRSIAREKFDVTWQPLSGPIGMVLTTTGSVTVTGRASTVQSVWNTYANDLPRLGAAMIASRISLEELAAFNGQSVADLKGRFNLAGIGAPSYDFRQLYDVNLTAISLRRTWDEMNIGRAQVVNVSIEFDKVGNRTRVYTWNQNQTANIPQAINRYYAYDNMNRQVLVDSLVQVGSNPSPATLAQLTAADLGDDGHVVTYNLAGERTTDTYVGDYNYYLDTMHKDAANTDTHWYKNHGKKTDVLAYDAWGRLSTVDSVPIDLPAGVTQTASEAAQNRRTLDYRQYDGASRVVRTGTLGYVGHAGQKRNPNDPNEPGTQQSTGMGADYFTILNGLDPSNQSPRPGNGAEVQTSVYDAAGRLSYQSSRWQGDVARTDTAYTYNAAGNLDSYVMIAPDMLLDYASYANKYTFTYKRAEGYLQSTITAVGLERSEVTAMGLAINEWPGHVGGGWQKGIGTGVTTNTYDANGHLVMVADSRNSKNDRSFTSDANGVIVAAVRGVNSSNMSAAMSAPAANANVQYQVVSNSDVLGRYGRVVKAGSDANNPTYETKGEFGFGYTAVGSGYPANTPTNWVVQAGETLRTIAKAVYGDAGQWYRIAEANGLLDPNAVAGSGATSGELQLGQVLTIPSVIMGAANHDGVVEPYNASTVVGDTTPTLPMPAIKKHKSPFRQFRDFVVNERIFAALPSPKTTGEAIHSTPGIYHLEGEFMRNPLLYNVGRTAVGIVTQRLTGFNWGSATWDAYFGYVQTGTIRGGAKAGAPAFVSALVTWGMDSYTSWGSSSSWTGAATTAAVSNAASQGVAIATGQQQSFSWRQLGASAAGGAVSYGVSSGLSTSDSFNSAFGSSAAFARGFVSGVAGGTTASLLGSGRVSASDIAVGAIASGYGSYRAEQLMLAASAMTPGEAEERFAARDVYANTPGGNYGMGPLDSGSSSGYWDDGGEGGWVGNAGGSSGVSERDRNIQQMLNWANEPTASPRVVSDGVRSYTDSSGMYRIEVDVSVPTVGPAGDRWMPDADGIGGTLIGQRMTQAEMDELDGLYPGLLGGAGVGIGVPNFRLATPVPTIPVLPVNNGSWTNPARPGNSGWVSTSPNVIAITGGKPVQFRNNMVNFDPWSQGRLNIPGMTGRVNGPGNDLQLGRSALQEKYGLTSDAAAERWLKQRGLTLHHNANGLSLDLVPSNLHNTRNGGIHHAGGATILRNWDYSKGTPLQFYNANQIATGARYLGGVGMAYGAYADGTSLYGQYQISQQTGNYANTISEGTRIAGGWAGAWAVGSAGAQLGATMGTAFGPVGIVVGGVLGGAAGGMLGYAGGSYVLPRVVYNLKGF